jgi:hypothetical protein
MSMFDVEEVEAAFRRYRELDAAGEGPRGAVRVRS